MSAAEQVEQKVARTAPVRITVEIHTGEHSVKMSSAPMVTGAVEPRGLMVTAVIPDEMPTREAAMTAMRAALDAMYGTRK